MCGINIIPEFTKKFHNDTFFRKCGEYFYPYDCSSDERMDDYIDCLWRGSRSRFTDGFIRGGCKYFTDLKGNKCSYDDDVCSGGVSNTCGVLSLLVALFVVAGCMLLLN